MSDELIGQLLGPYEIRMLLGKGGMSSVYLAYQPSMDRVVAIKVLPREFLHDQTFLARFQQEARTVAKLEHINILPVYDVGEDKGIPYIVMRYLQGGTVADLLADRLPDNEVVARILEQVASALDYAHARGIIHRDLKPSNVLLDQHGNAYLADFGIARMVQDATGLTGSRVIGTPSYVAPEQVKKGEIVTHSADIYSLGVLAYEMLAGEPPYYDPDATRTLMAHVMEPVPSIRSVDPNIPEAIDRVVQRALAKQAQDRYPSAGAFAEAFRRAVEGAEEPITGERGPSAQPTVERDLPADVAPASRPRGSVPIVPPAPGSRPAPAPPAAPDHPTPARRRGAGIPTWLVVPFVLMALFGGLALTAYALTDGDLGSLFFLLSPAPTRTPQPTVTPTGDGSVSQPTGEDPNARPPILPPPSGGDRLAFASNRADQFDIYIMDIDGLNLTRLTDQSGPDFDPAWSPDGNQIVYASRPDQQSTSDLWIMNADGSNKQQITTTDADDLDPDWSPDGQWIAFASNRTGTFEIYIMRPDGSELRQITTTEFDAQTPRWSPDGLLIGYHYGSRNRTDTMDLFLIDSMGGVPYPAVETPDEPDLWLDWAPTDLRIAYTSGQGLEGSRRAIFILDLATSTLQQVTEGVAHDDDAAWSPDGSRIAFDSDRDGDGVFDLFVLNVESGDVTQLTDNTGDNVAPAWQPRR